MTRFRLSFREINKILLLVTIASLAYKRGHFAGTNIPSPFQVLFVISLLLTIAYVVTDYGIKKFFQSFPKNILIAFSCLFLGVVLGWFVGDVMMGIPTTIATIRDFGTFTMSILTFFLVLFYTRNDERFATWCLYALLIPALSPFYYFFTHGFVGYWGVPNDGSLMGVVDPNLFSKTLIIPALFFISTALFAMNDKKWRNTIGAIIVAALYVTLLFWTVSRGSALSLIVGAGVVWIVFSVKGWSWKKLLSSAALIAIVLSLGFAMIPGGVKEEFYAKIAHTGSLPAADNGTVISVFNNPYITTTELQHDPRTDVRIFEWNYFIQYDIRHPLGIGPSASSINYQQNPDYLQLRPGNTYIQVWLWGGFIALIAFLYIIKNAWSALWQRWKENGNAKTLGLLGALLALSIAIVFDASLYFYWYFIILALAFQSSYES